MQANPSIASRIIADFNFLTMPTTIYFITFSVSWIYITKQNKFRLIQRFILHMFVYKNNILKISHSESEEFSSYSPLKFVFFLKSSLLFNLFYCFCMFVNKHFAYLRCACLKGWKVLLYLICVILFFIWRRIYCKIFISALVYPWKIDDSWDRYNLKTRHERENKIKVMRMACDLDVNSNLTIFLFKILMMRLKQW